MKGLACGRRESEVVVLHRVVVGVAQHSWVRKRAMSTPIIRDLAWRFFAGEDLEAGLATVCALNARGIKASLNFLGVHVRQVDEAIAATDKAIESLRRIHDKGLDSHVSVKLTQIGLDIDEALCRAQLTRILECAAEVGNFVRIDMEESAYEESTIRLFEQARDQFGETTVGIVVQSYLRARPDDLDHLIAGGSRIRLVKGGYRERAEVVYRRQEEIDAAFARDIETLLRRGRYPAIATHDIKAIRLVRTLQSEIGLDKSQFEFQMLYGVRPNLQAALVRQGYTVRCYLPYGTDWYGWALESLRSILGGAVHRIADRVGGHQAPV